MEEFGPEGGAVFGLVLRPEDPLLSPLTPDGPAKVSSPVPAPSKADLGGTPDGLFLSMTVGSRGMEMDRGDLLGAAAPLRLALADKVIW